MHNELHHTLVYQMWWNFYCTRYQSDSFSFIDMGNGFHCLRNFFQSCPAASAFGLQNKECRFPSSGQGNPNTTSLRNRTLMKCACHFDRQGKRQKKVSKTHAGSKSHSPLVGEDKSSYHQTGRPKKQANQNFYHPNRQTQERSLPKFLPPNRQTQETSLPKLLPPNRQTQETSQGGRKSQKRATASLANGGPCLCCNTATKCPGHPPSVFTWN